MEPLPWMVVHGATVFRVAAAGAALLGLVLGWLVPQALAHRKARQVRKRLGVSIGPGDFRDGAAATVSGRVEIPAQDGPILVTEGATIALHGTIELLAASHRLAAGKGLSPSLLEEGDRVRVRGTLQHDPVTDRQLDYRAMERRWELVPEGWGDLLVAFETSPRLGAPTWRALCRGAGAGLLVLLGLFTALGQLAARVTRGAGSAEQATTASLLTLASPLHREHALTQLAGALSQRCRDDYGQAHVDAQLRIAELRDDCKGAVELLMRHGQLERAAQRAHACGDSRAEAHAHYLRGSFEQASAAFARSGATGSKHEPPHLALRAHLLAGRTALAVDEARRIGAAENGDTQDRAYSSDLFGCMADSIERRARALDGPSSATAPRDERSLACRLLRADADPRLRTPLFLDAHGPIDAMSLRMYAASLEIDRSLERADPSELSTLCAARELVDPPTLARPLTLFGDVQIMPALGPPALARRMLERLAKREGRCALRGHLAAAMATFEAVAGDQREARRWAEQMESDFVPDSDQGRRATLLRAAIAVYTGDATLAQSTLASLPEETPDLRDLRWVAEIRGKREQALLAAPQERLGVILGDPHGSDPWSLTAQGDGARLARFLQRHDAERFGGYLLIAAPQLERGREELLTWFRWGDRNTPLSASPLALLAAARSREAAVEALGDPVLAAQERAVAEAFYQALGVRENALPLAILDTVDIRPQGAKHPRH